MTHPTSNFPRAAPWLGVLGLIALAACRAQEPGPAPAASDDPPPAASAPAGPPSAGGAGATPPPSAGSPADPPGGREGGAPASSGTLPDEPWTVGIIDVPMTVGPEGGLPVILALRTGTHPDHVRLTVELDEGAGMPGYHLEYVDRPLHHCGSGDPIYPVGDAWLALRLEPAQAHTESGEPTLAGREIALVGELAERIYLTCDFEGVVSLVLALRSPNPFRAFTLEGPRRLVVDVRR